ncbi:MAG: LysM peptidoglycan-binding domain-containing protein [Chloroflexi bacterium]|nr:MAG: LysM peptidoglycan-binding domain-containing protein [Chloroflexota bacterium]
MGHLKVAAVPLGLAAVVLLLALGTTPAAAGQYIVRPGDTLWSISQSHHLDLHRLVAMNDFGDPNLIHPGDRVTVPDPPPPPAATIAAPRAAAPAGLHGAAAKAIIVAAARRHGLNPNFALAVSFWESGWNQSAVSSTGAVGLMQIEPYTGAWAGPAFLGRRVDLNNATDNAELGSALLRHYLEVFDDPKLALAAYYQGETATRKHGIYPSSRRYVDGIWALRNRFQQQGA